MWACRFRQSRRARRFDRRALQDLVGHCRWSSRMPARNFQSLSARLVARIRVPKNLTTTRRESEVLTLLGQGLSNKEIGRKSCLSVPTVKHHVYHILEKLKLERRAQALRHVWDAPWLPRTAPIGRK